MKKSLVFLLLVCSGFLHAQHYVLDSITQANSGLINQEANTLMYAEDSPYFSNFFSKLDSLFAGKKKKLHIFHIGGSHIQADIYSNKIRTYLQNMNDISTSQRGFIFPYHLAHTNNPLNYRVEADKEKWKGYRCSLNDSVTWGLAGVSATFNENIDTIFIKSNYKNYTKEDYCFNKLRVFYNNWSDDYELKILDSGLVLSDSVNTKAAFRQFNFSSSLDSIALEVRLKKDAPKTHEPFLLMGLELMNDDPGIEYTSIGANGARFDSYTRCAYFEEQLALYKPDLFIISIGTNDAYTTHFKAEKFRENYENFMKMIQRVNPECAILLTVPNDSYYRRRFPNKNTSIQEEIIQELAHKYQMAVWDFYQVMGGLGSSQKWYKKDLMPSDRVHFTYLGYSIKADLLLSAMVRQWEQSTNRPEESLLTYFKTLDE
ncbi:GDSL-type esterase/lipase family protein [Pustulibacterium marinum]|nr:GDSL-type esterase/lipase family protein [Pustulibacterium marinum]